MDYITKKVPRHLAGKISRLQALMQLKARRGVTESEVLTLAVARLEEEMEKGKRCALSQLAGLSKGKAKSSASEIDSAVYGACP